MLLNRDSSHTSVRFAAKDNERRLIAPNKGVAGEAVILRAPDVFLV